MELLFLPFNIFIAFPPFAFVVALLFLGSWFWYRKKTKSQAGYPKGSSLLFAGIAWLLYGLYEIKMYFWSKTVVAPIRVDLLLIAPVLCGITVAGIIGFVRCRLKLKTGHTMT